MRWAELLDNIEREVNEVFPNKRYRLDVLKEHIHNGPSTLIDIKVTDKISGKRLLIDCHQLKRKELRIQEIDFLANYALDEDCTHAVLVASVDSSLADQVQEHAVRMGVAVVRFQPTTFRHNIGQVFNNAVVLQQKKQHDDTRYDNTSLNLKSTAWKHAQIEENFAKSKAKTGVPRKRYCRNGNERYHHNSEGVPYSNVTPRDLVSSSWWLRKGTSTLWKTGTIQVQPSDVWQIHHVPDPQQLPQNFCEDLSDQPQLTFHSAPRAVPKQRYRDIWEHRQSPIWLFNTRLPRSVNHVSEGPITPTVVVQPSHGPTGGFVPADTFPAQRHTKVEDSAHYSLSGRTFTATTKSSPPKAEHPKAMTEDPNTSYSGALTPKTASLTMMETMRGNLTKLFDETSQTPVSQETARPTGILQSQPQNYGTNDVSIVLRYPKVVKHQVLEPIVTVVGKVGEVALVKTMSVALLQLKTILDTLFPLVEVFPQQLVNTLAYSVHLVRVTSTLIRRTPQRHAKKPRRAKFNTRSLAPQSSHGGGRLLVQGWRPIPSLQNFQPMGRQKRQPIKTQGAADVHVCQVGRPQRHGAHVLESQNDPEATEDEQRNGFSEGDQNVPADREEGPLHSHDSQSSVSEVTPVKSEPSGDEQTYNSSTSHTSDVESLSRNVESLSRNVESLSPVKSEHLEPQALETSVKAASTETPSLDHGVELTATTYRLENVEDSDVKKEDTREESRDDGRCANSFVDDDSDDVNNDTMQKPVFHGLFEPLKAEGSAKSEAAIVESHDLEHDVGTYIKEQSSILSDESDNEDNVMSFTDESLGGEEHFVGNPTPKAESLDSGCEEEQACLASSRKSSSSSFYSFLSFFSFSSSTSSSPSSSSDNTKMEKCDGEEEFAMPKIETVDSEAVDSLYCEDGVGKEEKDTPLDIGVTPSSRKLSRDFSRSSSTSSSSDSVLFATPTRLSSGELSRVKYSNSPLNKYDGSPDMRIRVNRSSMLGSPDGSPRNTNGTPDMRWAENRESLCVKSPQGVPLNVNRSPDMRWKFNRDALLQKSPQGALLNVDGTPDRRFKVTRNHARRGRSNASTRTLVFT
ncbi:uncharacterized protein LOC118405930 [Branchiostoma floridae]|uniref:Uncharacterized protein LOC118405930 n=1 Tax=Branchiostoma floridae TaxID=7739 RepID=A0A9J7KJD0_BRAFL|nr:uncharacterized protein LOC118405930 [Branchiostoma floridae]XP_035661679.1 uncharacterized protein LOC118405930 [Branchiostoma floridae]